MYHVVNTKNFAFCAHTYLYVLCNSYNKQSLYPFSFMSANCISSEKQTEFLIVYNTFSVIMGYLMVLFFF
jgi:hypothetical protein